MKIICVGRNYVEHAKELGNELPAEPVIFLKPGSSVFTGTDYKIPPFTQELHYECELVLHIGKSVKGMEKSDALQLIEKVGLGIDFTARDVQDKLKKAGLPWEKAKAFDNSVLIGEAFGYSTFSEKIIFHLEKNGTVVQKGDTNLMIFSFAHIIDHVSEYWTLQPGDVIFTGTPAGVGKLNAGDVLKGIIGDKRSFEFTIT